MSLKRLTDRLPLQVPQPHHLVIATATATARLAIEAKCYRTNSICVSLEGLTILRAQNRSVLTYLVVACRAARQGQPVPSLLPADTSIP